MARKTANVEWLDFTTRQAHLLDRLDFLGNNGWGRNNHTDAVMPRILADCWEADLTMPRVQSAMESIGYSRSALHQLDRWESKRTTGKLGR